MIKRLKWDVLHGGGGGEESDSGLSSSDDSEAGDVKAAQDLLAELIENDPVLRARRPVGMVPYDGILSDRGQDGRGRKMSSASGKRPRSEMPDSPTVATSSPGTAVDSKSRMADSNSEDENDVDVEIESEDWDGLYVADTDAVNGRESTGKEGAASELEDTLPERPKDVAMWRECDLCPGKRFLNDKEVDYHLNSKRHARAVRKYERGMNESQAAHTSAIDSHDPPVASAAQTKQTPHSRRTRPNVIETGKKTKNAKGDGVKADEDEVSTEKPTGKAVEGARVEASPSPSSKKVASRQAETISAARTLKRKAAVKKKLKMKKQRKWERMQGGREKPAGGTGERSSKRKESGNRDI